MLVDSNPQRLGQLTAGRRVGQTAARLDEVIDRIDGAIVATPHHVHHPITMQLLEAGVPVLVEKPIADEVHLAEEMVAAAERRGLPLLVNQTRRLFPSYRVIHDIVQDRRYGELRSIVWRQGAKFAWPSASNFYFAASQRPRGVLIDQGAHVLDAICWWLDAEPVPVACYSDSHGGPEGLFSAQLRAGECDIEIKTCWHSDLPNDMLLEFERAEVSGRVNDWARLVVREGGVPRQIKCPGAEKQYGEFASRLLDNFVQVIQGTAPPLVPASSVVPSLRVIDRCYETAQPFPQPWYDGWEAAK